MTGWQAVTLVLGLFAILMIGLPLAMAQYNDSRAEMERAKKRTILDQRDP